MAKPKARLIFFVALRYWKLAIILEEVREIGRTIGQCAVKNA